jgi:ribosomal protein L40E
MNAPAVYRCYDAAGGLPALRALSNAIAAEIARRERKTCPDCGAGIGPKSARCRKCNMSAKNLDPEFRARQAEAMRANWQDPEFRARQAEAVRANWQDPEFRARHAEATRGMLAERWQDPEFRARLDEAMRANWQDPEFRARQAEATRARFIAREQGFMIDLDDEAVMVFAAARDDGVTCAEAREVALMDMAERGLWREAAE